MRKFINKKGFTLIELIVVMAVIAILVLLAAPRFLGYTKDANVAAMQADAKVLSNASLQYNIKTEAWPVTTEDHDTDPDTPEVPTAVSDDLSALTAAEPKLASDTTFANLDETKFSGFIKNIKGKYSDYVLVISGEYQGEIFHKTGVEDAQGNTHFGAGVEVVKVTP